MSGKDILEDLSQGNLDNLQTRIRNILTPILNSEPKSVPSSSQLNTSGLFCVKFLHASISCLGTSGVKNNLTQAILLCCRGYSKCKDNVKLQNPLTVEKLLFHIISKMSYQECLSELVEIAEFLYQELHILDDEEQKKAAVVIVMNSYTSLWNTALKMESQDKFASFEMTAHIRMVAVKFLTLSPTNDSVLGERIELAMYQFGHLQSKKGTQVTTASAAFSFVFDKFCQLLHLLSENEHRSVHVFKLVVSSVKHLVHFNLQNEVDRLLEIVKSITLASTTGFRISDAVCWLSRALILLDKFVMNNDNTKSVVDIDLLKLCLSLVNDHIADVRMGDLPFFIQDAVLEGCLSLVHTLNNGMNRTPPDLSPVLNVLLQTLDVGQSLFRDLLNVVTESKRRIQIEKAVLEIFHVKLQLQYWLLQMTDVADHLLMKISQLPEVKEGGNTKMVITDWSVSTLNSYLNATETSGLNTKAKMEEKYFSGYMAAKLGKACFSKRLHAVALDFYSTACKQLTEWCTVNSETVQKRVQEASLSKIYNCLADCQRREGLWHDAMETVVTCLILDPDHMTSLINMWFQLKKEAVKAGLIDVMIMTIKDGFVKHQAAVKDDYTVSCLQAELDAFHSSNSTRRKYPKGEIAILKDIVTLTSDPQVKAMNLLKLAQLLWLTQDSSEKSPKECVNDVISLCDASPTPLSCLVLGEANLWKFILEHEDICKQMIVSKSEPDPTEAEDEQGVENMVSSVKWYSLPAAEKDTVELLRAVNFWEKGVSTSIDSSFDCKSLLDSMLMCAAILRLCQKPVEEIRVLTVALKVCSMTDAVTETVLKVTDRLASVLLDEGFSGLASHFIFNEIDDLTEEQKAAQSILAGRLQLCAGQVAASFSSVEHNPISDSNNSWFAFLLDGKRKRHLSKVICHHACPSSQLFPLDLAHDAMRVHTGVVQFLLGRDFTKADSTAKELRSLDKWIVLSELLQSLLHLGQMYRHVGEAREARCYLREGIKISQAMCIPRWYSHFLLEMARVQSMAGATDEAFHLLTEVVTVLDPETGRDPGHKPAVKLASRNPTLAPVVKDMQMTKLNRLESVGEFESVRNAGVIPLNENRSDICLMSPVFNGDLQLGIHVDECRCSLCGDDVARRLSLCHSLASGEVFFVSRLTEKSQSKLKIADDKAVSLRRLAENRNRLLQSELAEVIESVKLKKLFKQAKSKTAKPPRFQELKEVGCLERKTNYLKPKPDYRKSKVDDLKDDLKSKVDDLKPKTDDLEPEVDCLEPKADEQETVENRETVLLQAEASCFLAEIALQNDQPDLVKSHANEAACLLRDSKCDDTFLDSQIQLLNVQVDLLKSGAHCISPHNDLNLVLKQKQDNSLVSEITDEMARCRVSEGREVKTNSDSKMDLGGESDDSSVFPNIDSTKSTKMELPSSKTRPLADTYKSYPEKKSVDGMSLKSQKNNCRSGKSKKELADDCDNPDLKNKSVNSLVVKSPLNSCRSGQDENDVEDVFDTPVSTKITSKRLTTRSKTLSSSRQESVIGRSTKMPRNSDKEPNTGPMGHFSPYKSIRRKPNLNKRVTLRNGQSCENSDSLDSPPQSDNLEGEKSGDGSLALHSSDRNHKLVGDQSVVSPSHSKCEVKFNSEHESVLSQTTLEDGRESKQNQTSAPIKTFNDTDEDLKPKPRGRVTKRGQTLQKKIATKKGQNVKNIKEDLTVKVDESCIVLPKNVKNPKDDTSVKTKESQVLVPKNDPNLVLDCKPSKLRLRQPTKKVDAAPSINKSESVTPKDDIRVKKNSAPQYVKAATDISSNNISSSSKIEKSKKLVQKKSASEPQRKVKLPSSKATNTAVTEQKSTLLEVNSTAIYDFDDTDSPGLTAKSKSGVQRGRKRQTKPAARGRGKKLVEEKENLRQDGVKTIQDSNYRISILDDIRDIENSGILEDNCEDWEMDKQSLHQCLEIPLPPESSPSNVLNSTILDGDLQKFEKCDRLQFDKCNFHELDGCDFNTFGKCDFQKVGRYDLQEFGYCDLKNSCNSDFSRSGDCNHEKLSRFDLQGCYDRDLQTFCDNGRHQNDKDCEHNEHIQLYDDQNESVHLKQLGVTKCSVDSPELLRADRKPQTKGKVTTRGRKKPGPVKKGTKVNPVEVSQKENVDEILRADSKPLQKDVSGLVIDKNQHNSHAIKISKKEKSSEDKAVFEADTFCEVDHDRVTFTLEKAFNQVRHFPKTSMYSRICRLLALQYLKSDPFKTAFYLAEASAVTLRHQALLNMGKRKRKLLKEVDPQSTDCSASRELEHVNTVRQELMFDKDVHHFTNMVDSLPTEWTVCQFSVVEIAANTSRLFLTRLQAHRKPITVELHGYVTPQGENIDQEFSSIMAASRDSMQVTDKNIWWQIRRDLNSRLEEVVANMESCWLGCWKGLLLGSLQHREDCDLLKTLAEDLAKKIAEEFDLHLGLDITETLVELGTTLSSTELVSVVAALVGLPDDWPDLTRLVTAISTHTIDRLMSAKRHPVLLVLDKTMQHLPWESIPVLSDQQVSRVPSLIHLHMQVRRSRVTGGDVLVKGVNPDSTFFVLNPDRDLPSTQKTFEDMFTKEFSWPGVVGEKPTADQLSSALTSKDLFVYCGHGSGSKYFRGDDLQLLNCRAVVLLMGCSSGELQVRGQLEAAGMALNYFLSGCPCTVANLWDVTDKDIDRFLESLLRLWMSSPTGTSLLEIVPKARQACRLPALIGAAPVVYGLPVVLHKSLNSE